MTPSRKAQQTAGNPTDGRAFANSIRKVKDERMRALSVDGNIARAAYLLDALRHLARYRTARAHSLAFALFPARPKRSASEAIQRVLSHAVKRGLAEFAAHPRTQHRYYALTKAGAAYLQDQQPELGPVERNAQALAKGLAKAEHREWTSMIEVSANLRDGMVGYDEFHLQGPAGTEIRRHMNGHVPDALTFVASEKLVIWHEVETSRRSRWTAAQLKAMEAKAEAWAKMRATELRAQGRKTRDGAPVAWESLYRRPMSGTGRFNAMLKQIRRQRQIPFRTPGMDRDTEFEIALVLHCGSTLIRDELCRLVRTAFDYASGSDVFVSEVKKNERFEMSYESKGARKFVVQLELLPRDTDEVWHNTGCLPFASAPKALGSSATHNERFIATES